MAIRLTPITITYMYMGEQCIKIQANIISCFTKQTTTSPLWWKLTLFKGEVGRGPVGILLHFIYSWLGLDEDTLGCEYVPRVSHMLREKYKTCLYGVVGELNHYKSYKLFHRQLKLWPQAVSVR